MQIKGIKHEKQGVIFDMDGLLVNSEELYWKANIQASKEYNLGIPDDSYLTLVGASVKSMDDFYAKYFASDEVRRAFVKRTDDLVWQWTDEGKLVLKPGVQDILDKFEELGINMGLASNNYKSVVDHALWVTGCRNYFDYIVTHDEVAEYKLRSKPFPDLYLEAQKKSGLAKDQLLIFEDSSMGVEAAANAGIDCVMIPDLKAPTAVDREKTIMVCQNFFQLSTLIF